MTCKNNYFSHQIMYPELSPFLTCMIWLLIPMTLTTWTSWVVAQHLVPVEEEPELVATVLQDTHLPPAPCSLLDLGWGQLWCTSKTFWPQWLCWWVHTSNLWNCHQKIPTYSALDMKVTNSKAIEELFQDKVIMYCWMQYMCILTLLGTGTVGADIAMTPRGRKTFLVDLADFKNLIDEFVIWPLRMSWLLLPGSWATAAKPSQDDLQLVWKWDGWTWMHQ